MTDTGKPTASILAFDIETYRTRDEASIERIEREELSKTAPKSWSKERRLAFDTEQARRSRVADALAKTSVDVMLAEPLVVVYIAESVDGRREEGTVDMMAGSEADGLRALADAWNDLASPLTYWGGHNVEGFDLPILFHRFIRCGVPLPRFFPKYNGSWWGPRVFDSMKRAPTKTPFVKLDALCSTYGIEGAKARQWQGQPMTGARVGEAYEAGEFQLIRDYCRDDVVVWLDLFHAMTRGGWLSTDDELVAAIAGIRSSDVDKESKELQIYAVLDAAGRIPWRGRAA